MSSNPAANIVKIIDAMYINLAGPFGQMVCEESLEAWQASDGSLSTQKIGFYIEALYQELADVEQRQEFIKGLAKHQATAHILAIKQFIQNHS